MGSVGIFAFRHQVGAVSHQLSALSRALPGRWQGSGDSVGCGRMARFGGTFRACEMGFLCWKMVFFAERLFELLGTNRRFWTRERRN